MEEEIVRELLRDGRPPGSNRKLDAAIRLIETLTYRPWVPTVAKDVQLLSDLADRDSTLDLILTCAGFNIIDRIADALDFAVPSDGELQFGAKLLSWFGYRAASGGLPWPWPTRRPKEPELETAVGKLVAAALSDTGFLSLEIRRKVFESLLLPNPLGSYVAKVKQRASEVTDGDVEALRVSGYTEDQIFEATVCAGLGAGLARLQIGLEAAGFTWKPLMSDAYRAFSH